MKHVYLLLIAFLLGSYSMNSYAGSPIRLSKTKLNTGKIVRSIPLDVTSISASIENKCIQIELSSIPKEILLSIYDQNGVLVHQESAKEQNTQISIDTSMWEKGKYTINFTDETDICLVGSFDIE